VFESEHHDTPRPNQSNDLRRHAESTIPASSSAETTASSIQFLLNTVHWLTRLLL
jgi:hypothetical protein